MRLGRKWLGDHASGIMQYMALHLHIDPFSGISGDMFLGAMLDLGVTVDQVTLALAALPVAGDFQLTAQRVQRHSIGAVDVKIRCDPDKPQPLRHYHHLADMAGRLSTSKRGLERANKILDALANAEAEVHCVPLEKVHFHETGAVDSIVDMFGSAIAIELLDIETVS